MERMKTMITVTTHASNLPVFNFCKIFDVRTAILFYIHIFTSHTHTHTHTHLPITSTSSHLPWGLGRSFTRGRLSESISQPSQKRPNSNPPTCMQQLWIENPYRRIYSHSSKVNHKLTWIMNHKTYPDILSPCNELIFNATQIRSW